MEDKDLEKTAESYAQGYSEVGYDDDQIASVRDAFIDGAKWAVNKACEWLYEYNSQQAKAHGSKGVLHIGEFTVNVEDFRKALEPLHN